MTHLSEYAKRAHDTAVAKGFWEEGNERNFGEMVALIHSELSEALEEHRAGRDAIYILEGKPEGIAVELADAVIRIFDLFFILGVDMELVMDMKMDYNDTRPYKHGKSY